METSGEHKGRSLSFVRIDYPKEKPAQAADARTADDSIRLRQLLKYALRSFGFKCVNIEVMPQGKERRRAA